LILIYWQKEFGYFTLQGTQISKDHTILVYSVNTKGGDFDTVYLKDIAKDSVYTNQISNVGSFVF